jgi:hypothetical protein
MIKYNSDATEAVDFYLKTDGLNNSAPLIDKLQLLSKEIAINEITVNGFSGSHLCLSYPNRNLHVKIKGKARNQLKIGIECLLFDNQEVLLGKFAPALHEREPYTIPAGNFTLEETVKLPFNMSNGDYYVQIEVTHPKIEYLAVVPKGLKLTTKNYISDQGEFYDYKVCGFLIL